MKIVKCEKLEKSMVELQFAVDAETYKKAVDAAFKRESKKYTVPGFRKGKATRAMIEKLYGADVFTLSAINDLFPENYEAAVAEAKLEPVGRPEADIVSESAEEGVVLKAIVPVKPEVTVGEYVGLKATKKLSPVTDEQVAAELARMQDRNARMITRDGAAENGDTVDIDFDGSVDGVHFDGGKAEHYSLVLGSGSFIPGFEEQVVGHKAGDEFIVSVKFPDEYQAAELAGKDAEFAIKLHEVQHKELPELDDDFAKDVSEFDTLDELKASIKKGMEEKASAEADTNVENELVDQIIAGLQGDIPEAMYETHMDELVRDFEYRISQQGLNLDTYLKYMGVTLEQFRGNFKPQAEKQVKIRLALEAIAAKENIVASDEDFDAEVKRIAENYKMEEAKVRELVNAEDVKKDLANNMAIDFVKAKAEITTEEVSAEESAKDAE